MLFSIKHSFVIKHFACIYISQSFVIIDRITTYMCIIMQLICRTKVIKGVHATAKILYLYKSSCYTVKHWYARKCTVSLSLLYLQFYLLIFPKFTIILLIIHFYFHTITYYSYVYFSIFYCVSDNDLYNSYSQQLITVYIYLV